MKSYLSLVPISAKVHKRQSRMTRICIILAVFLVTSIFSMVEMWTKAETTAMRHNHGDWHIALQNIQDKILQKRNLIFRFANIFIIHLNLLYSIYSPCREP